MELVSSARPYQRTLQAASLGDLAIASLLQRLLYGRIEFSVRFCTATSNHRYQVLESPLMHLIYNFPTLAKTIFILSFSGII